MKIVKHKFMTFECRTSFTCRSDYDVSLVGRGGGVSLVGRGGGVSLVGRGGGVVKTADTQSRESWFESSCCRFESRVIGRCLSSLSCVNE